MWTLLHTDTSATAGGSFIRTVQGEWSDEEVEQAAKQIPEKERELYIVTKHHEEMHKEYSATFKKFLPQPIRDAML